VRLKKRELYIFLVGILVGILIFSFQIKNEAVAPAEVTKVEETNVASATGEVATEPATYEVVKVVDGDTIHVVADEKKQTVRMIGVDTPESVDPRRPVQCFGDKASEKTRELLLNKKVRLESDPTQGDTDNYKRLLRYVFLEDGTNVNILLIEQGFGHQYTYNKPYKYREEFIKAEVEARESKRGLWADEACLN